MPLGIFGKSPKKEEQTPVRQDSGTPVVESGAVDTDQRPLNRTMSIPVTTNTRSKDPKQNYKILKKLGQGSFGVCYLVKDVTDSNLYVLKRMKCEDKEEMLEALKEMVMMRICTSPFSVKFKEFYKDDSELEVVVVMEFCEEGDLFKRLHEAHEQKSKLPEEQIIRWFVQILLGLDAIHAKQFLHRDIKPGNIFLGRWDVVKLGDFGLGALLARDDRESKQGVAGTPGFMAPEIQAGLPYNSKSDVYALGCTLYEMLTLRSAYYDTKNDLFPQPLPTIYSEDIGNLLLRLLTPDPKFRPSVREILMDPFIKDRAEAMRHEQDLLQRVVALEEKIGYKSAFRRHLSTQPTGPAKQVGADTKITDVANEWQKMVEQARASDSDEEDDDSQDDRIRMLKSLKNQVAERKDRERELEQLVQQQHEKLKSLSAEAQAQHAKEEDKIRLERDLQELRDRNTVYEMLLGEMQEQANETPGNPDADDEKQESLKAAFAGFQSQMEETRRQAEAAEHAAKAQAAKVTELNSQLMKQTAKEKELQDANRKLLEELERVKAAHASHAAHFAQAAPESGAGLDAPAPATTVKKTGDNEPVPGAVEQDRTYARNCSDEKGNFFCCIQ